PRFHPAMRHAGPTRRELGIPTAFNVLGPLANPAGVSRLMIGLADGGMAQRMIGVLAARGCDRVLIVHGDDGLDELTTTTTSTVWELDGDVVRTWRLDPGPLGLAPAAPSDLVGGDPAANAGFARAVLAGERGPHRDIVVLNAAAALLIGGAVSNLEEGVGLAGTVLDDGRAAAALDALAAASHAP
ncbi:MAG TPA: anthranilate phosphoribosyltransferase, partial [Acidimicrobiales bacterium]|nr:anthranilate phosphoribosyltransferase [Acidimicrobiales bacterium]